MMIAISLSDRSLARSESVIRACALEPFRSLIRIVYLEELVPKLESELKRQRVGEDDISFADFRLKYLTPTDNSVDCESRI